MATAERDFWPESVNVEAVIPPAVLLREQAALLAEKTKGLVRGEVTTTEQRFESVEEYLQEAIPPDGFVEYVHTLYLVVPALGNYRYALLTVRHDFQPYPCVVEYLPSRSSHKVEWERDFPPYLKFCLGRGETTRVIHALLSRISTAPT